MMRPRNVGKHHDLDDETLLSPKSPIISESGDVLAFSAPPSSGSRLRSVPQSMDCIVTNINCSYPQSFISYPPSPSSHISLQTSQSVLPTTVAAVLDHEILGQKAALTHEEAIHVGDLSEEELAIEKKLRRKIDTLIMPLIVLVYLMNYIDR
jgi:hypothetical protein